MMSGETSAASVGPNADNVANFPRQRRACGTIIVAPCAYGGFIAAAPRLALISEFPTQAEAIAYAQGLMSLIRIGIDIRPDGEIAPTIEIFPIDHGGAFRLSVEQEYAVVIGDYRSLGEARLVAHDICCATGWQVKERVHNSGAVA